MSQLAFRTVQFHDLTASEVYQILHLRSEVFVVEQDCVYLDPDDKDASAIHVLGYYGAEFAAYSRILPPGKEFVHIGRVIVKEKFRGKELGRHLMKFSMHKARSIFQSPIQLAAQSYLRDFYESLGFTQIGEEYLLDGIPHMDMQWKKTV